MTRLGLALSLISLCGPLMAQEEEPVPSACRPLFTTSAGVGEPGALELELGAQRISNRDGSEDSLFPVQFNLGVSRWFDLRFGWSGPMLRKDGQGRAASGDGDPVFGGQAQFLTQDASGLDLGLAYWHKLPRASVRKGLGTGRHDDTLVATASRVVGRWAFDVNAGANWVGRPEGPGRVRQGVASLAVTYAAGRHLNITFDTYAMAGTELGPRAVSSVLAVGYGIHENVCLDLGVEAGLTQGAPRLSVNAGLVWRLGKLW